MNKATLMVLALARTLMWCAVFVGCSLIVWAAAMLVIVFGSALADSYMDGGTFHVKAASYAGGVLVALAVLAFGALTRSEYRRLVDEQQEEARS